MNGLFYWIELRLENNLSTQSAKDIDGMINCFENWMSRLTNNFEHDKFIEAS